MKPGGAMERATQLHRAGRLDEARRLYLEISRSEPNNAEVRHRLGLIAQGAGHLEEAAALMRKAIELDARQAHYFFSLGQVLEDRKEISEAEKRYTQALALHPNLAPAHNHLGLLFQDQRRDEEALQSFRAAVRCNPAYARAYNNLGSLLRARAELAEAIACFREALRLNPDYPLARLNLSQALYQFGDMSGAEESYLQLAQRAPQQFETWSAMAWVQIVQNRHEQAEQSYRRALALKPDSGLALTWLGLALREQGRMDASAQACRRASALDRDNLRALLGECLALPPVYADRAEVQASRQKYAEGLARLRVEKDRFKQLPVEALLSHLQWSNFLLAYQGQDDRALQTGYAAWVSDLLGAAVPEFFQAAPQIENGASRRVRLGFLSSFLRECTVGNYFKSWITLLDRQRFEIFVYYTGHLQDAVSREVESAAEHYVRLLGAEAADIARRVREDSLDVLIYPEMGMDATVCLLGALRLAPIQCVAWGHPVTSGHKHIDYFLSCAAMEPEHGQAHYSEQLVLLSGIGTCYAQPACASPADRQEQGLPVDRHLYLCPQSLHKIHPDNDDIFLDILAQDPQATLVFFQAMFGTVTQAFRERLQRGMAARRLAADDAIIFLPRMDHARYLRVNRCCDLMLDTLHWSGGNTTLDALACSLPLVTLPGEFMRGRQSYAMLTAMGLEDLVARDTKDYVAIALRLASDGAWRQQIQARMAQNFGKVFGSEAPVRELEQFLLSRTRPAPSV